MNKLKAMKKNEGVDDTEEPKIKNKKFKKKQPNPLSCKKKKKRSVAVENGKSKDGIRDKTIQKKQRSRSRKTIPKHVKEQILKLNKS